jgi:hypothetical protein
MELTELERQRAAEFTAAFWRQGYKRSRQLLTPVETILPAHAWALRVSEAFEASSNPFQYLRTYRSIDGGRSVDDRDIAGKSRLDVYAKEIAEAKAGASVLSDRWRQCEVDRAKRYQGSSDR